MNRCFKALFSHIAKSRTGNRLITIFGGNKLHALWYVRSSKRHLLSRAEKVFKEGKAKGSFEDYRSALEKHWVSYSEYANQYEFYKKTETEREAYVSLLKMSYFYLRYGPGTSRLWFRSKKDFLKRFAKFIHREWLYVPNSSFDAFETLVTSHDCIVKPCDGTRGKGISKLYKDRSHKNDFALYKSYVKSKMMVEQCIESCEELKKLHPQSLNTIRVVTVSNKNKACVFSAVLRTGVGESVIDNSHAGGISAQIDVKNGIVDTDGANTQGERFSTHPNSGIVFKGFVIPKWDAIQSVCCEAAKMTDNPITGWDVVINSFGEVEFIEGNSTPDMDMIQTRYRRGVKRELSALIKEYCGIELK